MRFVFLGMAVKISVPMLTNASHQVRCNTDVDRLTIEARHDINAGLKIEAAGH